MITRTIRCDVCGTEYREEAEGAGFPGWGQLAGVMMEGVANPSLCPKCLGDVADFTDRLREKHHGLD